jgi:hypothetical protein
MRLTSMTRSFALAISGIVLLGTYAKADNFYFSFTNTIGNVPGTVTGEIEGLTNGTTSTATEVIIQSFPSALGATGELPSPPINATAWLSQIENSFTETGGVITAYDFRAFDFNPPPLTDGTDYELLLAGNPEGGGTTALQCNCGGGGPLGGG